MTGISKAIDGKSIMEEIRRRSAELDPDLFLKLKSPICSCV